MRTVKLYSNPAVVLDGVREMYTRSADDYEEIFRSAIEGEPIDLNEFADDLKAEPFYSKIQEIRMAVERYGEHVYAVAVCTVSDDWNDADNTPMLKWFMDIEYQYGWGSQFDGKTLHTFKRSETFEMTAPNGERFMHTCDMEYEIRLMFWHTMLKFQTEEELRHCRNGRNSQQNLK